MGIATTARNLTGGWSGQLRVSDHPRENGSYSYYV